MAKARALKPCTKGDYIKYCQSDDKSSLKGAWFCSRDPFLSAQLWTYKQFSSPLGALLSTDVHTTAFGAPTVLEATHAKA